MKVLLKSLLLLVWCAQIGYAQTQAPEGKITGIIQDAQHNPLPGVSVTLLNTTDASLVQTQVTSDNGRFVFTRLPKNNYILRCAYMGYQPYQSAAIIVSVDHPEIILPTIVLKPSTSKHLREVTVTSQKPLIEEQIDRTVVHPSSMITVAGSNLMDILAKSPGVTVTAEGDISLNGKGVTVLIDGKPTYLSAQDLAGYLRSIAAGTVDKLELMSNPPSKYDASGAAVINIRLKKNQTAGFNGNISLGYSQGKYGRSNTGINLNYRIPKMNIFSNLSYSRDQYYATDSYDRRFNTVQGEPLSATLLNSQSHTRANGFNGRLGADFFVTPKTTLGAVISGGVRPRKEYLSYNSIESNAKSDIDSTGEGYTNGDFKWRNTGVNLNFNHQYNKTGKELSADLDYIRNYSYAAQQMGNTSYWPDNTPIDSFNQLFQQPVKIDIYTFKSDYTQPMWKHGRLDAGIKSSIVETDNDNQFYYQDAHNVLPDYNKTNHFIYREMINAAYISMNNSWKRFSLQAGLRIEQASTTGHLGASYNSKDSSFTNHYLDLFPTTYLQYKLDSLGKNTLTLSYGRRIRRANYQQLNPFLLMRDQYSYTAGNPGLKPVYNNRIELKYSHQGWYNFTLAYDRVEGNLFQATTKEGNVFITRPENMLTGYGIGLISNISVSPVSWWSLNANVLLLHLAFSGTATGQAIAQQINIAGFTLVNQIKFSKTWSMELFSLYRSKTTAGQTNTKPYWYQDAGVQKTILKGKANVKLSVNDIFQSLIMRDETISILQTTAYHTGESDSHRIGLSFNYRFGKDAFSRKRNHNTGGADAEQDRVN
ncbi:MAG: outer membrane beta-barrel protein [Chitinophaga sp.]|uniref:outer membrane beta-barrel protein n=1 Tax=Chitinophaga sp. TaxID=1869181 RepID=UPI0025BFCAC9|nr:outer membrane beta-barrel protein [Chitinophaga sp.]MBV8256095.1 outer membrane beta-barrel protein [Chitinophaga sp.]